MDILNALRTFKISNILEYDDIGLKRKYRELIKANHPDIGGDANYASQINQAYAELSYALEIINSIGKDSTQKKIIIPFDKLITILSSNDDSEAYAISTNGVITRSNINSYDIIVEIKINLESSGVIKEFSTFELRTRDDTYTINCKYPVSSYNKSVNIHVLAYNKDMKILLDQNRVNINLRFNAGIKLKVMIEKQLI